jgi:hypothetical protein
MSRDLSERACRSERFPGELGCGKVVLLRERIGFDGVTHASFGIDKLSSQPTLHTASPRWLPSALFAPSPLTSHTNQSSTNPFFLLPPFTSLTFYRVTHVLPSKSLSLWTSASIGVSQFHFLYPTLPIPPSLVFFFPTLPFPSSFVFWIVFLYI